MNGTISRKLATRTIAMLWLSFLLGGLLPAAQAKGGPDLITPYFGQIPIFQGYHSGHKAYDFLMRYDEVMAMAGDETVRRVDWISDNPICHQNANDPACGYGLHIRTQGADGYWYIYGHLSATAFRLNSSGQNLDRGQILGASGNTGYSDGPHLHMEVRGCEFCAGVDFIGAGWLEDGWAQCAGIAIFCSVKSNKNPNRPLPDPLTGEEYVVDDAYSSSAGFSKGEGGLFQGACSGSCGGWTRLLGSAAGSSYGVDMYRMPSDSFLTDEWARWQPQGLPPAIYNVMVHTPNDASRTLATSWQARFAVISETGMELGRGVVDQKGLPDPSYPESEWVSIGVYGLSQGAYVYTSDVTGEGYAQHCAAWCQIGVDAIKFVQLSATYLPDVRPKGSGWSTVVYARNNGGGRADVRMVYRNLVGQVVCDQELQVPGQGRTSFFSCSSGSAATITASQDISVAVRQKAGGAYAAYAGVRFDDVGDRVHVPLLHNNNSGWNSQLLIQNVAGRTNKVTVAFKSASGSSGPGCEISKSIAARGVWRVDVADYGCPSAVTGAYIYSTSNPPEPIAVAATQVLANNTSVIESAVSSAESGEAFTPVFQYNNSGWVSGLVLQNASAAFAPALTSIFYSNLGGVQCGSFSHSSVLAHFPRVVLPAPPAGNSCAPGPLSARYLGYNGRDIAVNLNQILPGTPDASGYPAVTRPGRVVTLPFLRREYSGWSSGLAVQNTTGSSTSVSIDFYDSSGNWVAEKSAVLSSRGEILVLATLPVPSGFDGSAQIRATRAVAVMANHLNSLAAADRIASQIGDHR